MRVRIVVADESEACFDDIGGPRVPLQLAGRVENPIGRLRDATLIAEVPNDLVHQTQREVRAHVPREISRNSASPDQHP